jgi:hypothetical protein
MLNTKLLIVIYILLLLSINITIAQDPTSQPSNQPSTQPSSTPSSYPTRSLYGKTRIPEFPGYIPNPYTNPPYTGHYDSTMYTTSPGLKMRNCPSTCSYNGYCTNGTNGHCVCNNGFVGVDCSQRVCPSGKAWFDIPDANSIAHRDYT